MKNSSAIIKLKNTFFCHENGESEPLKARRHLTDPKISMKKKLDFHSDFFWADTKSKHGPLNFKTKAQIF